MALNNGGCFSGSTLVSMEDNSKMQISFLKVGDMVNTLAGITKVIHIIPFHFTGFMYNIGNHASVSAYHPIMRVLNQDNEYFFPKHQKYQNIYYKGIVYQLVLENRSYIAIGSDNGYYAGTFNNIIDQERTNSYLWCAQFKSAECTFDLSQPSLVGTMTNCKCSLSPTHLKIFQHPYCDTSNMDINMIGDIIENDPESVITKRC